MESENKEKTLSKNFLIGIGVFGLVAAGIAIGSYLAHFGWSTTNNHEQWGQFGDFFGGTLNPILSFLALIALLVSLHFQVKELSLTRKEVQNSTTELKQSRRALQEQSESLKQQNFENTFFHMISLHNDIISDMDVRSTTSNEVMITGRDCFGKYVRKLIDYLNTQVIEQSYEKLQDRFGSDINHYFRNLYTILKFLNLYGQSRTDIQQYINIVSAQLSTFELVLLCYNGLKPGHEKMKALIEKYSLLENMNVRHLHDPEYCIKQYDFKAFGNNPDAIKYHVKD